MFKGLTVYAPQMRSVLRIMASLAFMVHGLQKLTGWPHGHQVHDFLTMEGAAGIIETFGSLFLVFGFRSRWAAFIMSGEMAVGYFTHHMPKSFFPALNGGDAALLFCFIFLYIVFAGPGPWSIDGKEG